MKYNTLKFALAAITCLSVFSFAAIPVIRITTQGNQDPTVIGGGMFGGTQTMNYVKITEFKLEGAGNNNLTLTPGPDSIRVRGNSTAGADKKPYRIKFDKEQALFGKPKANSWVLLANYYDQTFALNAIAFKLGQKLGLEFTPTSQHVDLYLNGNYKGIYQLTEQIQVKKSRVDVDKDNGFLIEFDYHEKASDEIKFTAAQYSLGTFIKSPEVEGCDANPIRDCNDNNARVKWVKDTVNALMNKMAEIGSSGFPTNGYRDMIDLESFAKYVLIEQFMDNFDFNSKIQNGAVPGSNYAYKDYRQKIKAGPLWDFDLSAVPVSGASFGVRFNTYQEPIKPRHTFYQRLWSDPEFISKLKTVWAAHKSDFDAIPAFVDSISKALSDGFKSNRAADPADLMGMNMGGGWGQPAQPYNLSSQVFSQEISKLKTWWGNRVTFFNTEVNKLAGSTNPTGYTLAVARNPSAGGNVSVKIGSGSAQNNPSGQLSADANASITITATPNSGYTFTNWTAVSGSLPSGFNANSATNTFNITSNVNIRANFQSQGTQPTNYTLQVSRQTTTRGNVSVTVGNGTAQSNPTNSISVAPGTSVSITATPNSGVSFVNWTAAAGTELPAGITATSPSITFTMNANVNITANFLRGGTTTYTLTVNGNAAEGSVSVNGQSYTFGQGRTVASGESVTLAATAKSGYMFLNWSAGETALPSGINQANASDASVTFTMSGNVNIAANFRDYSGGAKTDTLVTVEAEEYTSKVGTNMRTSTNNAGITNIGYIENGYSTTYEGVNMAKGGSYKLAFRIASNGSASFRVIVNGTNMGTISGNTNDWDGYIYVALDQDVYLDAGSNTIKLEFQSAVNVDHFVIIGESQTTPIYNAPKPVKAQVAVTLKANPRGFTAMLPLNHGYTSYRLMDIRGREIKSGNISQDMTDLRFDGLKSGVLFLRLNGKGKSPLVLRAVAY